MSDRKRLLEELRVIDLRAELEKRNLDKSGIRSVLIQRLTKYLEEQGDDPATYKFELSADSKTPSKRTRRTESSIEPDSEETPAMEDMIVQDAAGDDDTENSENNTSTEIKSENMEVDESQKPNRKRESTDDCGPTAAKKPCLKNEDNEVKQEEDHKGENNTDAEDSINLDLGDDELLNEETDNNATKIKKVRRTSVLNAPSERAVLAELTIETDIDDGQHEDTAADGSSDPAPKDGESADAASSENQVNNEATTNSHDNDDKESRNKDDKDGDDKKDKKDEGKEGGARNLWVSGLSSDTRAKDLKQLCSKHGKVIGAKVVTNARTPGSRCYGYVTMASAQDAENCIKNLHRTELHGRMISVEKAKSESESSSRRQPAVRSERRSSKDEPAKEDGKDAAEPKVKKDGEVSGEESARSTSRTREKSHRSEKDRSRRSSKSRERRRSPREVLSFSKIWKERDEARARERSRAAREDERRRRAAEEALRERERRQRQEKHRLNVEREKLRAEREKIEREKNELLRLERERHRLEREKLELERLELKRAQLRLEDERRKRYDAPYRKPAPSPPPEPYERERHKRAPPPMVRTMTSSRGQFEAPPPPRFELAGGYERGDKRDRDRDYKRDYPRHVPSANNMKYPSNGNANDDARQPVPPGTRPKEPSRTYESRESRSYRPSPPGKPEPRAWSAAAARYTDAAPTKPSGGSGASNTEGWSGETRYAGGAQYEPRYSAYQPPPPGAAYPDRYAPAARDYPRKY